MPLNMSWWQNINTSWYKQISTSSQASCNSHTPLQSPRLLRPACTALTWHGLRVANKHLYMKRKASLYGTQELPEALSNNITRTGCKLPQYRLGSDITIHTMYACMLGYLSICNHAKYVHTTTSGMMLLAAVRWWCSSAKHDAHPIITAGCHKHSRGVSSAL